MNTHKGFTIYALCDPSSLDVLYVGRTRDVARRVHQHELFHKREFVGRVLEELQDYEDTKLAERRWIEELKPPMNVLVTASGSGEVISEETRANISKALTGRERTAEHSANLSNALKGRTMSDEFKAKRSAHMKARYEDPEERKKTAEQSKGRTHSTETIAIISAKAIARERRPDGRWY